MKLILVGREIWGQLFYAHLFSSSSLHFFLNFILIFYFNFNFNFYVVFKQLFSDGETLYKERKEEKRTRKKNDESTNQKPFSNIYREWEGGRTLDATNGPVVGRTLTFWAWFRFGSCLVYASFFYDKHPFM